MSFIEELKRRNVFRVGAAYGIAGWVILQVADLVLEAIEAPAWALKALLLVVAIGFVVALVVSWAYEMTPEGIKKEADVDRSQSITADTGRKMDKIIIGFLAIAVVLLLTDRFLGKPASDLPQPSSATAESPPVPDDAIIDTPEKSIAVLPFSNMSEDASNEFFADGISEEILNALAKVRELKVAGRTSAFAFKGRNEDLREIGEALGVNHILEGSVRKAGNTVRVTAQLIQVSDGFHLWSETFDRELTDIFAIQDEIANAILAAMKAELLEGQTIASTRVDPAVYEKYLQAKPRIYSRTRNELEVAELLLAEATQMDPSFAAAWAQRAIATILNNETQYGVLPLELSLQRAGEYLDTALALEPDNAEALAGMGLLQFQPSGPTSNNEAAIPYLERSLEINPSLIDASNWLQLSYSALGRHQDAIRIMEEIVNRDPLYQPGIGNLLGVYGTQGKHELARRLLDRIRPYVSNEGNLAAFEALVLANSGQFGKALSFARTAFNNDPENANRSLALSVALLNLGQDEELIALEKALPYFRVRAMTRKGRLEEGLQTAQMDAARFRDPTLLINYFFNTRQEEMLVGLVEQIWSSVAELRSQVPGFGGYGYPTMTEVAHAYRKTGNMERFEEAMQYIRAEIDQQFAEGFDSYGIHFAEANYWAMAGDSDKALEYIRKALDRNGMFQLSDSSINPIFDALRHEKRFRDITLEAHERVNEQRAIAGLEPIDPEQGP